MLLRARKIARGQGRRTPGCLLLERWENGGGSQAAAGANRRAAGYARSATSSR
jgi:hypothetical protein